MKRPYLIFLLLFICQFSIAQIEVTGIVTDGGDESELIGVTIMEKGTENGTVSDFDGSFAMTVQDENAVLVISYVGYATQEITVGSERIFNVTMLQDENLIDEVVVIGYGVAKKKVVTGAISKVKSEDLEDMPVTRIENALQGRTSGVRITSASGQPGEGAMVRVRGTTSINGSEPLYVVDGVPIGGGIDFLSPGDIESIEVLKDAASASIYGTRAAAGVILVTTKKGANKDNLQVNYNMYYGIQNPWRKLPLLNATEYATIMNEASVAGGGGVIFENPASYGEGTDWQDAVFNDNAPIQNHEFSIAGGNDRSDIYTSFSYFDQTGIVSQAQSSYERITARFNSTHKVNDFFTIGQTLAYTKIKGIGVSTNSEFGSPLSRAINIDPITPILETDPEVLATSVFSDFPVVTDENGTPYGISQYVTSEVVNPVAALSIQQGEGSSDKIVGNVFAELSFLDGFKLRSSFGIDRAFWFNEWFTPIHYLNATNRADLTNYGRAQNRGLSWIWQNTLSYSKLFADRHNVTVLLGLSSEKNQGQGIGGSVQDIPVDNIEDASLGYQTDPESQLFWGYEYLGTLASYFGRVMYNLDEKYLFSFSMRVDGSYKFGRNNKFGNFPSVSLGWVVTEESFFPVNDYVNFLKIRGSWGVNGSDQIPDFSYTSTVGDGRNYTFGQNDILTNGATPNNLPNPDLRWEETTQIDIGFDAKLFKKLELTFDYFIKKTDDMLLFVDVPDFVGIAGGYGNIASLENRGVELELTYSDKLANGFSYGISGNVSHVENEITFLGEDKEFLFGATFGPQGLQITRTSVGLPIGYFYGHQTDGIFQTQEEINAYVGADGTPIQPEAAPGDFKFVDLNNDGMIDDEDRGFIGDPTPDWTYGLNLTAGWKGVDFVLFGQGQGGNQIFNATRRFDLQMANYHASVLDRWTGPGTSNDFPRLTMNDPNKNFSRSSDFFLQDGDFFRIKTLQIGYNLPTRVLEKMRFKNLRIYVSGNNLWTITKYKGFDPEIIGGIDRGIYPQPRFYLVGVNATF